MQICVAMYTYTVAEHIAEVWISAALMCVIWYDKQPTWFL